ncbi:hypothetical protein [Crenothrix polyspora]|uniref:Uncharacterized protein n=1 Tax=Crenothrix polyspora TaxID=360316 RepID=A0A1R4HE57_9GAMM|nr:hypothetical protein [Crenothrix polyspora]SJM94311.1 conserved hypothetical protein [Crenothrix polyspora]
MKKRTKEQTKEINQLALLSDEAIDTSDIPEQINWENAVVGRFYSKHNPKTSVNIDSEILAWFKAQSSHDYHYMINKALFDYMKQHNQ